MNNNDNNYPNHNHQDDNNNDPNHNHNHQDDNNNDNKKQPKGNRATAIQRQVIYLGVSCLHESNPTKQLQSITHTHTPNRSHVGVVRVHELQESQDTLSSCISSLISSTFISSLTIARHQVGIREHCVRRFIRHGLRPNPRRDHTPHMGGTYERL